MKIKQLTWIQDECDPVQWAETPIGPFFAESHGNAYMASFVEAWGGRYKITNHTDLATIEEAKAKCQEEFERRVMKLFEQAVPSTAIESITSDAEENNDS